MTTQLQHLTSYARENNQHITIEAITLRGLAAKMKTYFKLNNTPLLITASDKWRVIASIYKQENRKVDFPILTFRPSTYEINSEGYNTKSLNRMGRVGSISDNGVSANRLEIIPVRFNIEVSFFTDDYYTMSAFANRWLFASVNKTLNMSLRFDDHQFPILVSPDSAITIPQKDNAPDMINLYELESTLFISGYMSLAESVDNFPKVPIINQINVGFKTDEGSEPFDTVTRPAEE